MSITFGSWSGVREDVVESDVHTGGSTAYRLLICLGIEPSEGGELELDTFSNKLHAALEDWGPDNPGYPDAAYVRAYGRGADYVEYWLDELVAMCAKGRERGHRFIVWM